MNPTIVLPEVAASERLSNYVLQRDEQAWASSLGNLTHEELARLIRYEPQKSQCFWRKLEEVPDMVEIDQLITYPANLVEYQEPAITCQMLTPTGRLLKLVSASATNRQDLLCVVVAMLFIYSSLHLSIIF